MEIVMLQQYMMWDRRDIESWKNSQQYYKAKQSQSINQVIIINRSSPDFQTLIIVPYAFSFQPILTIPFISLSLFFLLKIVQFDFFYICCEDRKSLNGSDPIITILILKLLGSYFNFFSQFLFSEFQVIQHQERPQTPDRKNLLINIDQCYYFIMIIFFLRCIIIDALFFYGTKQQNHNRSMSCPPKEDQETDAICNEQSGLHSDLQEAIQQTPTLSDLIWFEQLPQQQCLYIPKYRKEQFIQCRKWASKETQDFYKLLKQIGPDFSSMAIHQFFAGRRNKRQLRNKFRKEQRINSSKIGIILDCFFDRPLITLIRQ